MHCMLFCNLLLARQQTCILIIYFNGFLIVSLTPAHFFLQASSDLPEHWGAPFVLPALGEDLQGTQAGEATNRGAACCHLLTYHCFCQQDKLG